jgi:hypothetical protein
MLRAGRAGPGLARLSPGRRVPGRLAAPTPRVTVPDRLSRSPLTSQCPTLRRHELRTPGPYYVTVTVQVFAESSPSPGPPAGHGHSHTNQRLLVTVALVVAAAA